MIKVINAEVGFYFLFKEEQFYNSVNDMYVRRLNDWFESDEEGYPQSEINIVDVSFDIDGKLKQVVWE